jgi:hypothetical protein
VGDNPHYQPAADAKHDETHDRAGDNGRKQGSQKLEHQPPRLAGNKRKADLA